MQINGFNKSTLLDYPKHLAATVFLGGCNMRCPFCHNASLVLCPGSQPEISEEEVLSYLKKRRNILEGVCITGGEPTLYNDLPNFISEIKSLDFKVKLDTNGTNPTMIKYLSENHLIDFIAMDIKNSRENYKETSGIAALDIKTVEESVSYLLTHPVDYEFRTTVTKELHTEHDILSIANWIKGAQAYYLQAYKDSGDIISPGFTPPSKELLLYYKEILSPYINTVILRGID